MKLTGRHVLMIAAGWFGVVLLANVIMATSAIQSFSGLVVPNSYVASQTFDRDRNAQEALGWDTQATLVDGRLHLTMTDGDGRRVAPSVLEAVIGRPHSAQTDRILTLEPVADGYVADAPAEPGQWQLTLTAVAADGTAFRQRLALYQTGPR